MIYRYLERFSKYSHFEIQTKLGNNWKNTSLHLIFIPTDQTDEFIPQHVFQSWSDHLRDKRKTILFRQDMVELPLEDIFLFILSEKISIHYTNINVLQKTELFNVPSDGCYLVIQSLVEMFF